jgi:predicted ATPase
MQAWPLALLGYPEQAIQRGKEALAHARQLAHPYSLGYALVHDMCCWQYLRCVAEAGARAEQAIVLGAEQSFPNWLLAGMAVQGWVRAQTGQVADGIAQISQVISLWRGIGAALVVPYFLTLLAESYGQAGQFAEGLAALDEALAVAEKNDDRWYEAEIYRLKGEFLLAQGDRHGAHYLQRALAIARQQGARLLELRTAVSLSRLWHQQGRHDAARALLTSVYGWFTEGFALPDLQEARVLLTALV